PGCRGLNLLEALVGAVTRWVAGEEGLAVAGDDGEQVVEIVSDAAREPPDGFHLLSLAELFFFDVKLLGLPLYFGACLLTVVFQLGLMAGELTEVFQTLANGEVDEDVFEQHPARVLEGATPCRPGSAGRQVREEEAADPVSQDDGHGRRQ